MFTTLASLSQTTLVVHAGNDTTACPNASIVMGGHPASAAGGFSPYTYSWSPANGLSSTSVAAPTLTVTQTQTYILTVTDAKDTVRTDTVTIHLDNFAYCGAGNDTGYCLGQAGSVQIGATNNSGSPITYTWTPIDDLSNPFTANPIATPSVTTTYSVEINSPACGTKTDVVTVSVYSFTVDAGANITIMQGTTATLYATPNDTATYHYWWNGGNSEILYQNSPSPDVTPSDTTIYILNVVDKHGCVDYDSITVYVIPQYVPVFYTVFTPNSDGNNDTWYIGNNDKFPENKLQIYNRYGQLLFSKTSYQNDWNGKYFGNELPAGTYFYIYDTKTEAGKFNGSVTIIR